MLRPFRYTMWRNVIVLLCLLCTVLPRCAAGQCDVEYVLDITEEVISPACSPRLSLVVNGTLPGPLLSVNAGQHVHIRSHLSFSPLIMQGLEPCDFWKRHNTLAWSISVWISFQRWNSSSESMAYSAGKVFWLWIHDRRRCLWHLVAVMMVKLIYSWSHVHVGIGLLTAHGALIVRQPDGSLISTPTVLSHMMKSEYSWSRISLI